MAQLEQDFSKIPTSLCIDDYIRDNNIKVNDLDKRRYEIEKDIAKGTVDMTRIYVSGAVIFADAIIEELKK